jgi:hypothetical protein
MPILHFDRETTFARVAVSRRAAAFVSAMVVGLLGRNNHVSSSGSVGALNLQSNDESEERGELTRNLQLYWDPEHLDPWVTLKSYEDYPDKFIEFFSDWTG